MRWLFRWAFRLLILLVVLVVAGILLLDTIAREILQYRLHRETGLEVKVGKMHVGLQQPSLTVENLIIYNSAEFGGSPLIDLPELHLEYDRNPLFNSRFQFKLIRLNLARLNVVEDKSGRRNLDSLDKRLKKSGFLDGLSLGGTNQPSARDSFHSIGTLNLSLGRATYLKMKDPGKVQELKIDIRNQVFTNVRSEGDLQGVWLTLLLKSNTSIFGDEGKRWLELLGPQKKN